MDKKTPVVAGSYQQYLSEYGENPHFFYVNSVRSLAGIHNVKVLLIGTYYERPDWDELQLTIQAISDGK